MASEGHQPSGWYAHWMDGCPYHSILIAQLLPLNPPKSLAESFPGFPYSLLLDKGLRKSGEEE